MSAAEQRPPQDQVTVTRKDDTVVVGGAAFADSTAKWSAVALDEKRIMLFADDGRPGVPGEPTGMATCPIEVFKDFVLGLHHAGWSGLIAADTGYGVKKIYFAHGEIVFAGSNVMDDRLGEVIFREARISLDELTNSAAQVTKARKFGQVLISSGIFTNMQLWQALKLQTKQILRSLFMVDRIFFEMKEGLGFAPTEVIFQESQTELIGDAYSYGCAFRAFLGKLRAESEVVLLVPKEKAHAEYEPGTFVGDLVAMIEERSNVQELLNTSKLIDTYTVAALFNLVNQGFCKITPDIDDGRRTPAFMAPLKAKIDAYSYVLGQVRKAFSDAGKDFPATDLRAFASSLNPEGFPSLFVDSQGQISRDCLSGIVTQCTANPGRVGYFSVRAESMIQFLLQVAGDNLAFQAAKQIRADYRTVTA